MHDTEHDEAGDTLLEIVLAIVIIGLVVSAFFATYSTQGSGSTAQRRLVTADNVLRNYAESIKSAVREQCASGSTYTVSYTSPDSDYALSPDPTTTTFTCPPTSTPGASYAAGQPWQPLTLAVTVPGTSDRSMPLVVRSP